MSYTGSFPSGQKKHPGHILWLISARGSTGGLIKPLGATQSHSKAPKAQKGDFFTPSHLFDSVLIVVFLYDNFS